MKNTKVNKKPAKPAKAPAKKAVKPEVKKAVKATVKPEVKKAVKAVVKPVVKKEVPKVAPPEIKLKPGRKKFTLEYIIRSSPAILFEFVSQPDSLAQWFSDVCDQQDDIFIFGWGADFQRARQVDLIDSESVQYHWEHGNPGEYFAFKVYKSEIADDTILEITDFADAKDIKEQSFLWDKQVDDLRHAIGA